MPTRTGFFLKHKFLVRVGGFAIAKFQSISALTMTVGKIEYREGGTMFPDLSPGLASATDVTLVRGVTAADDEMRIWFNDTVLGATDQGQPVQSLRRDVDVEVLNRLDQVGRIYRLFDAWPMEYTAGEWDNTAEEVVVETLQLAYRHYDRIF